MEELKPKTLATLNEAELLMLAAYKVTGDACSRYHRLHGEPMCDDEWWETLRDSYSTVGDLFNDFDVWNHFHED